MFLAVSVITIPTLQVEDSAIPACVAAGTLTAMAVAEELSLLGGASLGAEVMISSFQAIQGFGVAAYASTDEDINHIAGRSHTFVGLMGA